MLAAFRALAGTWPARLFFLALAVSFVGWGVAGKLGDFTGANSVVARAGGMEITPAEFTFAFSRDWKEAAAKLPDPTLPPPGLRANVAQKSLQRLINQKLLAAEIAKLHLATPDAVLRKAVYDMPGFKGFNGKFDHDLMLRQVSNNQMTETQFLEALRKQYTQDQLTDALSGLEASPDIMTQAIYSFLDEARTADMVEVSFNAHNLPALPADAVLQRFWSNHQENYSTPEYRHVKIVLLSPKTVGKSIKIADSEIDAGYQQLKSTFEQPEKRSIEVISVPTDSIAKQLLAKWRSGADWATMQVLSKAVGATAVAMDDTPRSSIPSPELAKVAFGATAGQILGPVKGVFGEQIVHLRSILPATSTPIAQARQKVRDQIAEARAGEDMDARSQKLQDLFAGGSTIDEVPADIGAQAFSGTMDASGFTQDGSPIPLPGSTKLVQEIVGAAFKAKKGDAASVVEGPDRSFYALSVDVITPPSVHDFASVRDKVARDWQKSEQRRATEIDAAQMLQKVQAGGKLIDVAGKVGLSVTHSAPILRGRVAPEMPRQLPELLFSLAHVNDATMLEQPSGFVLAQVTRIIKPEAAQDPHDYNKVKEVTAQLLNEDLVGSYLMALRSSTKISVNQKLINALIEQAD